MLAALLMLMLVARVFSSVQRCRVPAGEASKAQQWKKRKREREMGMQVTFFLICRI